MNMLVTALIALLVLGLMVYRQFVTRQVTLRDLALPFAGIIYLAVTYLGQPTGAGNVVMIVGATLFGLATGLIGALVVKVWRDGSTGVVMQRGGWKYLAILAGLILFRLLLRVIVQSLRLGVNDTTLNDAFIGMAVANYAGRAVLVGIRAMALLGWDWAALPTRRDVRSMP